MKGKRILFSLICLLLLFGCTNQYSSKNLKENGYLVYVQGTIENYDYLLEFVDLYENEQNAELKVAKFTDEGDPVFHFLTSSAGKITYTYNSTQDHNGFKENINTTCSNLIRDNNFYVLQNCEDSSIGNKLRLRITE